MKNPFLPPVKWTAKRLATLDKHIKGFGKSIGITKSTVPDIVLWPFRRAAYFFVLTMKKIGDGLRWVWGSTVGRVVG